MIVAFDETANNVFFNSKYFCALIVIKELNLIVIYQISLIITPKCIDSKTKDQIIKNISCTFLNIKFVYLRICKTEQ